MKKYNVNELLEKKKDLEKQLEEFGSISQNDLEYDKKIFIDHTNDDKEKVIEQRPRITLNEFTKKYNTAVLELSGVNIAIQKHNAKAVVELLQKRESFRKRISFLENIKRMLPKNKEHQRGISRQKDDKILETVEVIKEPMFSLDDIEKQYNECAAEERKLNTEIQKINLNAQIEFA